MRNGSIAGRYMQYTRQMCMRRSKKVVTVTPLEAKTGKFKSTNRSSQKGRQTKKECTHGWYPSEFPADHDCQKFIVIALVAFHCLVDGEPHASGEAVDALVDVMQEKFPDVWEDSASVEWLACSGIY